MKRFKEIILSVMMIASFGLAMVPSTNVGALDLFPSCGHSSDPAICKSKGDDPGAIMKTIVNLLLFIIGGVSVIMIIYAGIEYTISAGNSSKVEKAKNTLIYSVVGLVVAMLAGVIVNFVITALK